MTEEERKLLQDVIDSVYGQFLEAVVDGREEAVRALLATKADKAEADFSNDDVTSHVKQFADGRIFSGEQAFDSGLVDKLGTFQDAVERVQTLAGLTGEPNLVSSRRPKSFLESLAGETRTLVRSAYPGQVSLEYRFALP
jgi:protease-4